MVSVNSIYVAKIAEIEELVLAYLGGRDNLRASWTELLIMLEKALPERPTSVSGGYTGYWEALHVACGRLRGSGAIWGKGQWLQISAATWLMRTRSGVGDHHGSTI